MSASQVITCFEDSDLYVCRSDALNALKRDRSIFTSMESANDRTCFLQESVMQARRQQIMTVLEVDFMA